MPPHPAGSSFLSGELDLTTAHREHPAVVAVRYRVWEGTRSSFMSSRNPIESSGPVPVGSSPYRGPRNTLCAQVKWKWLHQEIRDLQMLELGGLEGG